jgi:uncharacterized ferritin-like protein (DUF455 family)
MAALFATKRFSVLECGRYEDFGTLRVRALEILTTNDLQEKVDRVKALHKDWFLGRVPIAHMHLGGDLIDDGTFAVPDFPGRPSPLEDDAGDGAGASVKPKSKPSASAALLHGICHAESYAIDLFVDLLARFGTRAAMLPKTFYDDFIEVCRQEADHYFKWHERLEDMGVTYGTLPVHDGLWRAAYETRGDLLERLAVINMVHEARGLDTYPMSRKKLSNARDTKSVAILDKNFSEEITHVAKGVFWFTFVCEQRSLEPKAMFQEIVLKHIKLPLKGPFNFEARAQANFDKSWYSDLST